MLLALLGAAARAQSLLPMPSPNGPVHALTVIGNTLYVGGGFDRIGTFTGGGAAVDATSGQLLPGSAGFRAPGSSAAYPGGSVTVAIPDGAGGWFVGGDFSSIGGVARPYLARVNPDGSLAAWAPPVPNGSVWSLLLSGSTLYVGGDFTSLGATPRSSIAALDAATGAVTAWNPGADNRVAALALSGTTLYVGGSFNTLGGASRPALGALDTGSNAATSWAPGLSAFASVSCLALGPGVVYVGGYFSTVQGVARTNVAAVDAVTGTPTAWAPDANGNVRSLIPSGSSVFAGGEFTSIGGRSRIGVAMLNNSNGHASASWNASCDDYVYQLALDGSTLYVAGAFTTLGGQARSKLGAIGTANAQATSWAPSVESNVWAISPSGGGVWIGGLFQRVGAVTRRGLAAIDLATRAVTGWNPDVVGTVRALATDGTTLYVGGTFSQAGGLARNALAAYALPSAVPTAFDATANLGTSMIPEIFALSLEPGVLRAGGNLEYLGGQLRHWVGAVDAATGVATAWAPEPNSVVRAILPSAGGIYLAGAFSNVGGESRLLLAQVDPASGAPTTWVPPLFQGGFKFGGTLVPPNLFSLAERSGVLYVGGSFRSVSGQSRANLAALDPSGTLLPWNPTGIYEADASIGTVALDAGAPDILVASTVPIVNGFRVVDASTAAAEVWPPFLPGVYAVARAGGHLIVGGQFLDAGTTPSPHLAVFVDPDVLDVSEPGTAASAIALAPPSPNPTSRAATIRWVLAHRAVVSLSLVDLVGRRVRTIVDRLELPAGPHTFTLATVGLVPGVYLLDAEADGERTSRKLLITR